MAYQTGSRLTANLTRRCANRDAVLPRLRDQRSSVYAARMEHLPSDAKSLTGSAEPLLDGPQGTRQPEASEPRDAFFPRTIGGLDTALGLRRAMGLEDFYISMLRGFVDSRRDTARHIQAALRAHDMKKAEYLSHSLLGISAQIGAIRVPADAQELENAISSGTSEESVSGLLLRLEASLTELIESLESALPQPLKHPE